MRYERYTIVDLTDNGKVSFTDDDEMADHVSQHDADYVLWVRMPLRDVVRVTQQSVDTGRHHL